jgi:hypothetical protein
MKTINEFTAFEEKFKKYNGNFFIAQENSTVVLSFYVRGRSFLTVLYHSPLPFIPVIAT